jgi:hypothetical protein
MEPDSVPIREFYNNFTPPRHSVKTVRRLLDAVPANYLTGLDAVILTNQSGLSRRDRLGKVTSRGRRRSQGLTIGRYHPTHAGNKPWIELYVDKIERGITRYRWLAFVREVVYAHVLFHELGHHLHYTQAPEHREKEDVADAWSRKLMKSYFQKRYWYLLPVRKPVGKLLKLLARSM